MVSTVVARLASGVSVALLAPGCSGQDLNGAITFLFECNGRPLGSPFDDATGLDGGSLTVQYHDVP